MPLKPIQEIAKAAGIPEDALEPYGKYKAKISASFLREQRQKPKGKLVLVTAITPTKAGEGKTTTSIALAEGFGKIGQKAMLCLRRASVPCLASRAARPAAALLPLLPKKRSICISRGTCMR